jgi:hypothetical protein
VPHRCEVREQYWGTCHKTINIKYPCGIRGKWYKPWKWRVKWCNGSIDFPYPCLKHRSVNGWCYNCTQIRKVCYGFWCTYYCCDNGKEYSWKEPAFFLFGESWEDGVLKSSTKPLKEGGECIPQKADPEKPYEPPGPGPGPGPTPPEVRN